ncbi:MAG: NfeD family protein [Methanomicrobiales archaeon]|nr:NfeD family protein [Methanomicrobiales archaeon]
MAMEGIAIGWILVIAGFAMLLIEAYNPGFFIAVPGTVLIILGIFSLIVPGIFSSVWIVVIGVVVATLAAGITVWFYGRLTPDGSPVTVSRDTLAGKKGQVIASVVPDGISGKVSIDGVTWSARTEKGMLPAGSRVRVVRSEGVHVIVEEVQDYGAD